MLGKTEEFFQDELNKSKWLRDLIKKKLDEVDKLMEMLDDEYPLIPPIDRYFYWILNKETNEVEIGSCSYN